MLTVCAICFGVMYLKTSIPVSTLSFVDTIIKHSGTRNADGKFKKLNPSMVLITNVFFDIINLYALDKVPKVSDNVLLVNMGLCLLHSSRGRLQYVNWYKNENSPIGVCQRTAVLH